MIKRVCGTILSFGFLVTACAVHGLPVTFAFTGHLTQIASLDPASPFPDPISDDPSNPTTFAGSFTFNSLAVDGIPADPATGSYASAGGLFAFRLSLGGLSFDFGGVNIGILNNYPFPIGDEYEALYFQNPTDDNPTGIQLLVQLTDLSANVFAGDSLPLSPPVLSAFTFTKFFFTDTIAGNQVEVAGVIDTLRLQVPEPATSAMLLTGLCLIAWQRRVRRSARRTYRI